MGFNRYEAKLQAKASMRGAYPHPMLVTLVFVLATGILPFIISMLVANPYTMIMDFAYRLEYMEPYLEYLPPAAAVNFLFNSVFRMLGAYFLLGILVSLYTTVMNFGYTSYALRLARREQPSYRNLLDGFSAIGRVLLTGILSGLFLFLWQLLALVGLILVMLLAVLLMTQAVLLGSLVMLLGILAYVLVVVALSYRYVLAYFFLLDHPDWTALQCITASKLAMRGNKWAYFVMELSFIGWAILVPFTLGILSLWLTPYRMTTAANFYDAVTSTPTPGPGPYSGNYDSYNGPYSGPYQGGSSF